MSCQFISVVICDITFCFLSNIRLVHILRSVEALKWDQPLGHLSRWGLALVFLAWFWLQLASHCLATLPGCLISVNYLRFNMFQTPLLASLAHLVHNITPPSYKNCTGSRLKCVRHISYISSLSKLFYKNNNDNTVNNISSTYIWSCSFKYILVRPTRSAGQSLRTQNTVSKSLYGQRAFNSIAPSLWNDLPVHIRQADPLLIFEAFSKTHLCESTFL